MANHLADESSPYLLQHRNNPVDWYPWGPAAISRAVTEDKPIFLSIGYSACHWCHVMEHESFENADLAAVLNEHFVAIKVDREERPDLDQIYMNAVQAMTGHGGWPMSVFLTPELKPFFGGTYWPPEPRMGMPGFGQVLSAVADAWKNRRDDMLAGAQQLTDRLEQIAAPSHATAKLSVEMLRGAASQLQRAFDNQYGGFGRAPKFPHPMDLQVLLRHWFRWRGEAELAMVTLTLDRMASGGIYDHLGGGFARYSIDARWLVPHFEKMLYDNALLAGAYLDAHLATGRADYAQIVRETLDYLLRDMTDPAGGIYSTEDADSEGVEGKFYVWTPAEVANVLGAERAKTFCYVYDVSDAGNFEEHNILNLPKTISQCAQILGREMADLERELAACRAELFAVRERRVRPGRDDKVLVSWNGLAIDVLARAAGALGEPRYLKAAIHAADFLLRELLDADGRLLHTWRLGKARLAAYLDDYAALANSLVSLYEASFDERFIDEAVRLADTMLSRFADPVGGGFFFTADDHERLITRTKDLQDGSVPSGNSLAATALVRLGKLCGRQDYLSAAERIFQLSAGMLRDAPSAAGQMLLALDLYLGPTAEIVLLADRDRGAAAQSLASRFIPRKVAALRPTPEVAGGSVSLDPIFAGKTATQDEPVLYVCRDFACQAPVVGEAALEAAWDKLAAESD